MSNPFKLAGEWLSELGFFDFVIPMLITAAVVYALLRKAKVFGEGAVAIHAVIALSCSFLIWGFAASLPTTRLGLPLSKFITQTFLIVLIFLFGLVGASIAYPDFGKALEHSFGKSSTMIWVFIAGAIIIFFFTSGLGDILNLQNTLLRGNSGMFVLILLFLFIGIALAAGGVLPRRD